MSTTSGVAISNFLIRSASICARPGTREPGPASPVPSSSLRLREDESESRPAAGGRLDLDLAVVELNNAVDHREADTRAPLLGREVEVEDLLEVLGRNADAGVFDVDLHAVARGAADDPQRAAVGHRLTRVQREI